MLKWERIWKSCRLPNQGLCWRSSLFTWLKGRKLSTF